LANSHGAAWCLARLHRGLLDSQGGYPTPLNDHFPGKLPPGDERNGQSIEAYEGARSTSRRPGILIVDDDAGVRELLTKVLLDQGFVVFWASNGRQAIEVYQKQRPDIDVVLLDIQMPGLDGPQTLAGLQKVNPEVYCCFMTGGDGNYTEDELLERGALHVLQKPFHLSRVVQLVRQLVDLAGMPPARAAVARNVAKLLWRVADSSGCEWSSISANRSDS
jgi:CheY-like chemotaxis protein